VFGEIVRYVLLGCAALFFLFPLYWIFSTAFKTPSEHLAHPPVWFPATPTLVHFEKVYQLGGFRAMLNSFIIAAVNTLIALIIGGLAGYSLARYRTGGWNLAFWFLSQRMLPPVAVLFPLFVLFRTIGWVDTYQALMITYLVFNVPFVTWMMRGYFREVPLEVEEAALIDGASRFSVIWHVAVPLARPGLIATAVFCYIFSWTEFLFALMLSRTRVTTITIQISNFYGGEGIQYGPLGATSILATIPIIILTLAVQRHFVRGLSMGALKG